MPLANASRVPASRCARAPGLGALPAYVRAAVTECLTACPLAPGRLRSAAGSSRANRVVRIVLNTATPAAEPSSGGLGVATTWNGDSERGNITI